LSADGLFDDALLSAAFFFVSFLGAVVDFGKAKNRFGRGLKIITERVVLREAFFVQVV